MDRISTIEVPRALPRPADQLCHARTTELINSGVSIEVVRRCLGHASTETTQIDALLADAEIRAARRRRETRRWCIP